VASGGDVSSHVVLKDRAVKTTPVDNGVAGGRPSVAATTETTSKDSTTASRTQVAPGTTSGQTKHRFKRKPRILFSQAQVIIVMTFVNGKYEMLQVGAVVQTSSSAIAERPRDASCLLA